MKRSCLYLGVLAVAMATCFTMAGSADASIQAYSNLNVINARLTNATTGGAIVGTFDPNNLTADVLVTGLLHNSAANASATGFLPVATAAGPALASSAMNTLVADVGVGAGLRGQNNFSNFNYTGTEPTSAGDTFGQGALVDLTGANPADPNYGVTAQTVAESELSSFNLSQAGAAGAQIQAGASFVLIPRQNLTVDLTMDASLFLEATSNPSPPGFFASANSGWNLTVTNPNGTVALSWTPDGSTGLLPGTLGASDSLDPFALGQNVSAGPGVSTIQNFPLASFKATATLLQGVQYQFDINHTSRAQVVTQDVIPEPGAFVVWGLLLLTGSVFGWRRFKKV